MAAAGADMPAFPEAQKFTTYSYHNLALKDTNHEHGVMWVDGLTRQVSFQSAAHITPWHGAFIPQDDGVRWEIFFNAKTTSENIGTVKMRSTVMMKSTTNEWVGHDYQGRDITMKPLSKFRWAQAQNGYVKEAEWSNDLKDWVYPLNDGVLVDF